MEDQNHPDGGVGSDTGIDNAEICLELSVNCPLSIQIHKNTISCAECICCFTITVLQCNSG